MKVRLLKKCRKTISVVNMLGLPATKSDKNVSVVFFRTFGFDTLKNSKGKTLYVKYGNAINKRRIAIVRYARLINNKPWYWHLLH